MLTLRSCVLRDSLKPLVATLQQGKTPGYLMALHSTRSAVCGGRPEAQTRQSHSVLFTGDNVLCKRTVIVGHQTVDYLITF